MATMSTCYVVSIFDEVSFYERALVYAWTSDLVVLTTGKLICLSVLHRYMSIPVWSE